MQRFVPTLGSKTVGWGCGKENGVAELHPSQPTPVLHANATHVARLRRLRNQPKTVVKPKNTCPGCRAKDQVRNPKSTIFGSETMFLLPQHGLCLLNPNQPSLVPHTDAARSACGTSDGVAIQRRLVQVVEPKNPNCVAKPKGWFCFWLMFYLLTYPLIIIMHDLIDCFYTPLGASLM